ncbi:NAD(P)H-quinone dehydrogenase [Calidifontibacter sp. DB0510]|uniref:NAD(P)H-quinone dehydrogenase n=1 Tax=Metallococcus carri TaxID=1656884 RepID=A0A967EHK9_9MICO|nr:NAD(P)H-quinone dehydrogenase [Metallococcus carri]NHN56523.1 NAD(P)H-quinone dehydrogenase [Metallococcus carri]NOP38822.1 NAD(P)H-quinone dehydrogenase [Calidifontibacter sp. DB2511S]
MKAVTGRKKQVVVVGGGPGGYEAALVGAQLGAQVTVIEKEGLGGAAVLTDCVPSKTLIATSDFMSRFAAAGRLGVGFEGTEEDQHAEAHMREVNSRILDLAKAQSHDIKAQVESVGGRVIHGTGRILGPSTVEAITETGHEELRADVILVATGTRPRVMATAQPDGERILTWQQIYDLAELPEKLIVVGSGVTGAELAHAYLGLGSEVTLVSSRDRVLPGSDADAATVIENVFRRRGMKVLNRSRMTAVERRGDSVLVTLEDGRQVEGSHALLAVGSIPQTKDIGLDDIGVELSDSGHIVVDRVSRTSVPGVYAAGDCTGVMPLASVAAMQGRIAMAHSLGDAVSPLNLRGVCANIFTDPEIATVGYSQQDIDEGRIEARIVTLPLSTNPRAKMRNIKDGFVKLITRPGSNTLVGGVVVAPQASELIYPIGLAVQNRLTVDQIASTFSVYPSMTGSIAEAARRLHETDI